MRVLLDACVPRGLRDSLSSHEVRTAPEMGWGDLDNGDLLDAMTGQFDVLVTVDKRLPQEQRIADLPFGVNYRLPSTDVAPCDLILTSELASGVVRFSPGQCIACAPATLRIADQDTALHQSGNIPGGRVLRTLREPCVLG